MNVPYKSQCSRAWITVTAIPECFSTARPAEYANNTRGKCPATPLATPSNRKLDVWTKTPPGPTGLRIYVLTDLGQSCSPRCRSRDGMKETKLEDGIVGDGLSAG